MGVRPQRLQFRLRALAVGAIMAATLLGFGVAPDARADGDGCETVLWGFFGKDRRTICDGPVLADGSWIRERLFWSPARNVPLTTTCSGGSWTSTCTTSGGYFQPAYQIDYEQYRVFPSNVLPDEPGHLAVGSVVAR